MMRKDDKTNILRDHNSLHTESGLNFDPSFSRRISSAICLMMLHSTGFSSKVPSFWKLKEPSNFPVLCWSRWSPWTILQVLGDTWMTNGSERSLWCGSCHFPDWHCHSTSDRKFSSSGRCRSRKCFGMWGFNRPFFMLGSCKRASWWKSLSTFALDFNHNSIWAQDCFHTLIALAMLQHMIHQQMRCSPGNDSTFSAQPWTVWVDRYVSTFCRRSAMESCPFFAAKCLASPAFQWSYCHWVCPCLAPCGSPFSRSGTEQTWSGIEFWSCVSVPATARGIHHMSKIVIPQVNSLRSHNIDCSWKSIPTLTIQFFHFSMCTFWLFAELVKSSLLPLIGNDRFGLVLLILPWSSSTASGGIPWILRSTQNGFSSAAGFPVPWCCSATIFPVLDSVSCCCYCCWYCFNFQTSLRTILGSGRGKSLISSFFVSVHG